MKKMIKRLLAVLLLMCMLVSFTGCGYMLMYGAVAVSCILPDRAKTYEGVEHYAEDCKDLSEAAIKLLPDPASFPDGEVVYHCCSRDYAIFTSTGMSLFVTYPEDLYPEKKEAVLSEYEFLDAPIIEEDGDRIIPAVEFPYKKFQMNIVNTGAEDWAACKTILMIGYDDVAHRIAYCLMIDQDLDYIGEPDEDGVSAMQEHMDLWFYWIS